MTHPMSPEDEIFTGEEVLADSVNSYVKTFLSYFRESSTVIKQSFFAIFLSIITDIFGGLILGKYAEMLQMLPGLVVLVPASIGLRGNIFAALGSRLGSSLHLGTIEKITLKNRIVKNNIYSTFTLSIVFSIVCGIGAKFVLFIFGLKSISLVSLILISFIGGIISGIVLLAITFGIAFTSYKRGWDPDNVTSPIITALGDFLTIPALFLAVFVVSAVAAFSMYLIIVVIGIALLSIFFVFANESDAESSSRREGSFRVIVMQSSLILSFTVMIALLAGVFIEFNMEKIAMVPVILMLLPVFLEEGGNVGSILTSRLTTKIHMGTVKPSLEITSGIKKEFFTSFMLAAMIFPVASVLTFIAGYAFGLPAINFWQLFLVTVSAGFLLTMVVTSVAFIICIVAYQHKMDPDNVTIPIITSAADLLGVYFLLVMLRVLGMV